MESQYPVVLNRQSRDLNRAAFTRLQAYCGLGYLPREANVSSCGLVFMARLGRLPRLPGGSGGWRVEGEGVAVQGGVPANANVLLWVDGQRLPRGAGAGWGKR